MLTQILIKNFAIVRELALDFSSGMTVLTGETGAGKSIIIDAVELALGKRATRDVIGQHGDHTDILVGFDIAQIPAVQSFLEAYDLQENHECWVRRVIRADNSKNYINQIPVTLKMIQDLRELLINIHGQHEFQILLKAEHQRNLLDQFAHHSDALSALGKVYDAWTQCKKEWEQLTTGTRDVLSKKEFLGYQIKELDELNLLENEFEELEQAYKKLANADVLLNHGHEAIHLLSENDICAQDLLYQALQSVISMKDLGDSLSNVIKLLEDAQIGVREAVAELDASLDQLSLDPNQFQHLESRLEKIHDLARKHHIRPQELFLFHQHLPRQKSKRGLLPK